MRLKDKYRLTSQEKEQIRALEMSFFENNHALLHGGKLTSKTKQAIDELYSKYLDDISFNWSTSLLEAEMSDIKRDFACKNNTNKSYWIKSYMLGWLTELPIKPSIEYFFDHLTTREANRQMLAKVYEL